MLLDICHHACNQDTKLQRKYPSAGSNSRKISQGTPIQQLSQKNQSSE